MNYAKGIVSNQHGQSGKAVLTCFPDERTKKTGEFRTFTSFSPIKSARARAASPRFKRLNLSTSNKIGGDNSSTFFQKVELLHIINMISILHKHGDCI